MPKHGNILVIPDLHLPAEHKAALVFCKRMYKKYKCDTVVFIGDLWDSWSLSTHVKDPDLASAGDEAIAAYKHLRAWIKAFPDAYITYGNHDIRYVLRAKDIGLPDRYIRSFNEVYGAPKTWRFGHFFDLNGVHFTHGTGSAGQNAAINKAKECRQSVVLGHVHSYAGVQYSASHRDLIFAMGCGTLVDIKHRAFLYGKNSMKKPILGCGVVLDGGQSAQFLPLNLGSKVKILKKSKK